MYHHIQVKWCQVTVKKYSFSNPVIHGKIRKEDMFEGPSLSMYPPETRMAMEKPQFEDVYISYWKKRDFPMSC